MKNVKILASIASLLFLVSCGKSKSAIEASSTNLNSIPSNNQTEASDQTPTTASATEKILSDIETVLVSKIQSGELSGVSEEQVASLFDEISNQLDLNGLLQSGDLKTSLPEVLKLLSSNASFLNLDSIQLGQFLGVVGQGSVRSVLGLVSNSIDAQNILQLITSELLTDLPQSGASASDLSSIAQILVGRLTQQVQDSQVQQIFIPLLLQAITKGSASGLDQLSQTGLDQNLLVNIAQNIMNGFVQGQTSPQQFLVQQLLQLLVSKLVK